jgi:hypothetical protein
MATLWITGFEVESTAPVLRDWLAGDWALLFSHPNDFYDGGLEADRWLDILRDEFRQRGVRPLACARAPAPDASWVSRLLGDERLVLLGRARDVIDLRLRSLRDDLQQLSTRFVLIIDEALRRRGVLTYGGAGLSVSPLDLLSSIDVLRRREPRLAA